MGRRLFLAGLLVIVLAAFLEVTFYFVYIFKPIDRIAGRDLGVPRGVPTASEIFTSPLLSSYFKQADESKIFYSERLGGFTEEFGSLMSSKSSFVKTAEANYTLAGTVQEIKIVEDKNDGVFPGYDITLKNSTKEKYEEHISPSEAQYARVYLRIISTDKFSREEMDLADIKVEDYLVVKRSTNLLNPAEVNIEIEILR
jgi:hypothetical protein